ncbi:MAG TPA: histidine triad nucleotide-binding protein [Actinocrinis sp.]|nr:histidine triad nucleotide-binding protein [Actinocrinis sp.]
MTNTETAYDSACLFCRIAAREVPATIVRETEDFVSFRDISPQAPTHVLVIPKRHGFRDAGELALGDPVLAAGLLAEGFEVAKLDGLTGHADVPGYRFVLNSGDAAGQTVYHVHLHVLGGDALGHFGAADHGRSGSAPH